MNNSRRLSLLAIVSSFALLAFVANATATERFASQGGSGSACTEAVPCQLQQALAGLSAGDIVSVNPGTYDIGDDGLYVPPETTLRGLGDQGDVMIVGSTISPAPAVKIDSDGLATNLTVLNFESGPGVEVWGGKLTRGNVYSSSSSWGACRLNDGRISDSVCEGNYRGVDGRFTSDTHYNVLRNVTAIGRSAEGIYVEAQDGWVSLDAKAVIVRGVGADIVVRQYGNGNVQATFSHSLYSTSAASEISPTTGSATLTETNIVVDTPLFVDASNSNYRQLAGSPTVNAGASDEYTGTLDLEGNSRIQGSAVDIGAYEAEGVAPSAPTVTSPAFGPTKLNAFSVTGTAEAGSEVKLTIDGTPAGSSATDGSGNYSIAVAGLSDGAHNLMVTATDPFLNVSPPTALQVVVDTKKPKLKKRSVKISSGRVTVKFKSSEKAKFTCKLDKGKAKACKSTYKTKARRGKHKLVVVARDAAGNKGKPLTIRWRV